MKQERDILPFLVNPALIPVKVALIFQKLKAFLCNFLLYSPWVKCGLPFQKEDARKNLMVFDHLFFFKKIIT